MMLLPTIVLRWLVGSSIPNSNTKISRQPLLRLNANNEFNIVIISDLHYGEEEDGWGITQDINSTRVINEILEYEEPDVVVLSITSSILVVIR